MLKMTAAAANAAALLLARFRRQRPLRGGSLLMTIFGDAILPRGGAVALGSLIDLASLFGLNERLVRTATARLAKDGWLEGRRAGKMSEYCLSPDGRVRFAEATQRIYNEPGTAWSGRWTVVVLPPMPAAQRRDLKEELVWLGFGELSTHVFAHPELDARSIRLPRRSARWLAEAVVFDASLPDDAAPQRLASLGWNLEELGVRYRRFVKRFERVLQFLEPRPPDQECFIVRTLLIHEYRRLHLRDPLLPPRLLRVDWPGARAAALCGEIYSRVFAPSEAYLARVATRLDGPLPGADRSVVQRFGGITLSQ